MPRFVDPLSSKDIQASWWAEKEICTIKRFSYGDRQFLASNTIQMGVSLEDMETVTDVMVGRMNLAILERGIKSWTDADGVQIPVTLRKIEQLEEADAEFILAAIQELNPAKERSPSDQAEFRGVNGDSASE